MRVPWLRVLLLGLLLVGCNRAGFRIPGASGSFHPANTGYVATDTAPSAVVVVLPVDKRSEHLGQPIAGTRWKSCDTDPFWGGSAPRTIGAEIARELQSSRVFQSVNPTDGRHSLVLETEIRALCSQAIGFIYARVAGITSLHFRLRDGETVLFERTLEDVVTDADPEYTGPWGGTIEHVMKITISDSVRGVLAELLTALDGLQLAEEPVPAASPTPGPPTPARGPTG